SIGFAGWFVFWVAWIGFILIGVSVLGIVGLQEHVARFFGFLPRLFAALFVFFFGLLGASFFSRAALLAAVNADLPSPRLIASTIRTIIIVFARSEEHTSELQSRVDLVCRLLLEKKKY